MAFHDILVQLDRTAHSTARLTVAAQLAAHHKAGLIGLRIEARPHVPQALRGGIRPAALEAQAQALAADTARIEAGFRAQAAERGLPVEWWVAQCETDWAIARVVERARHASLTVLGQAAHDGEEELPGGELLHQLLLASGRPVLVVPETEPADHAPGRRVSVAWNGTRESARALSDAMPVLALAEAVQVVAVGEPAEGHDSLTEIGRHLARHEITAQCRRTCAADSDVGATILATAAEFDADLVVMGGYGHSRMREVVLGGATRHVLRHALLPILMSH